MLLVKPGTERAHRVSAVLAIMLVLNLISTVATPGIAVSQERPALTYFALGDSYASGHGLEGDGGKDSACRQSPGAYPYVVNEALSADYGAIKFHHLACSGATAAPTDDFSSPFKSLVDQIDVANAYLNHRDNMDSPEPVLVTITIGANDIGLTDIDTLRQILRPSTALVPGLVFPWAIALDSPDSALDFFDWLEVKSSLIVPSLTSGIDTLLAHENVHLILTNYPNPFREGGFGPCNDFFRSLSCDDAMKFILMKLDSIMLDQFLRVDDPGQLRVATLGSLFASHYSDCAPFVASENASETWFQPPYTDNLIDNMDACVHPNQKGAQAIAGAIVPLARTMLPAPAADAAAESGTGSLTVEIWDNRNNMRDTTSQCVQLVGATDERCAYDSPDGLIRFDGIPAGTHEICVTRRFEGDEGEPIWVWAFSQGPASVTISPGSHESITLYVFMHFGDSSSIPRTLCGFDEAGAASGGARGSPQETSQDTPASGGQASLFAGPLQRSPADKINVVAWPDDMVASGRVG